MSRPAVSVLIDTYNHERYIEQAVLSAIEQEFPTAEVEIVVVDDGSTDQTPEIVRKFAPRVRLLRKTNGGQGSAFNAAIPELRGEIVSFLDGDDWFTPGKLTAVMTALKKHPEAGSVGHGHYEFHELRDETVLCMPPKEGLFHLSTAGSAIEANIYAWPYQAMGALTVRKEVLERVLPIPEGLTFCADGPIRFGCLARGVYILKEALFHYRHHSDNLYSFPEDHPQRSDMTRKRLQMHERIYEAVESLLPRLGVPSDSLAAFIYPDWIQISRSNLRAYGGSPIRTFRTEMRFFRMQYKNPKPLHRLYKYLVTVPAMLLLPPRVFYHLQDWSARPRLNRLRVSIFKPGSAR